MIAIRVMQPDRCRLIEKIKFASDSPLEGTGFELLSRFCLVDQRIGFAIQWRHGFAGV